MNEYQICFLFLIPMSIAMAILYGKQEFKCAEELTKRKLEDEAIKAGAAHYDSTNGKFKWGKPQ